LDKTKGSSVGAAALIVMSSIVVSRITGFFREMLVPNFFGIGQVADAYSIAFKITGLMYDLLVGGAIAAALIPVLTGYIEKNEQEDGWKALSTFINVVFAAMAFTAAMGMVFAPWIVPFFARGFDKETSDLTVSLIRILFPSVAFLMLAGISNGILNSYKRFAAAAYGPTIYNLGSIASIIFLSKYSIKAVAFGVMCSAAVYFLFQLSFALKNLKYYRLRVYFRHPGFNRLIRLAIPSLISSSIVQVNVVISSSFASLFGPGSVAALNIADRVWQLPYGIFAQGMGIAMLPTLSGRYAVGDLDEYRNILQKSLKTVLFFTIPSALGFVVLKYPLIKTILKFTHQVKEEGIENTGRILMFFSIALITHSIVAIINRGFYAVNDTKTPLFTGMGAIAVNFLFSFIFYTFFNESLAAGGMALAYSIASLINAAVLLALLNRKVGSLGLREVAVFILKIMLSSLIMALILAIVSSFLGNIPENKLYQILILCLEIGIGAVVYFVMVIILKVKEAKILLKQVLLKAGFKT
jgi:putative peptidoglycan lipid II flippase